MHNLVKVTLISSIVTVLIIVLTHILMKHEHSLEKFKKVFTMKSDDFIEKFNDLDGYCLDRFLILFIKISLMYILTSLVILCPFYYNGNDIKDEDFWEKMSINNVGYGSQLNYAVIVITSFNIWFSSRELAKEDKAINSLRLRERSKRMQNVLIFRGPIEDISEILDKEEYEVIYQTTLNKRESIFNILLKEKKTIIVYFKDPRDILVYNERIISDEHEDVKCKLAPLHYNLIKNNVDNSKDYTKLIYYFNMFLTVSWIFFIGCIQSLSNIEGDSFLMNILPFIIPAFVMTVQSSVPFVHQYVLTNGDKLIDSSEVQMQLISRYTPYIFSNMIVSMSLKTIIFNIDDAWSDSLNFIRLISDDIPNSSVYFASLLIYKIFIVIPLEISRVSHYFLPTDELLYGFDIPPIIGVVLIMFIFSIYTPLVSFISFICFILYFFMHRNRFNFPISKKGNTQGKLWVRLFIYCVRCQIAACIIQNLYFFTCFVIENDAEIANFTWNSILPFLLSLPNTLYLFTTYISKDELRRRSELRSIDIKNISICNESHIEYRNIFNVDVENVLHIKSENEAMIMMNLDTKEDC